MVDLMVDTDGLPQDVHIAKSGGEKFDENAIEAVKKYRFKPAVKEGHPVTVELNVEVHFVPKHRT